MKERASIILERKKTKEHRIIGQISGRDQGPTLIFFGGLHGNEPAGVLAMERLFPELEAMGKNFHGALFGIRGNLPALEAGKRFIENDLNRMWYAKRIDAIKNKPSANRSAEERELLALYSLLSEIMNTHNPPYYFIDFHTTSSKTLPFITINDAMINRKFARLFPVPIILGLEEYLEGPLLSHINEKGYVSLGFESGQHEEKAAITNAVAFMWLALVYSGFLDKKDVPDFDSHSELLTSAATGNRHFYEIIHRHAIRSTDRFEMYPGFSSFERVAKGTPLARHQGEELVAKKQQIVFMPLYQKQGDEGYFLIRKIPEWALRISAILRKIKAENLLLLLPGISRDPVSSEKLVVNLRTARFMSKRFFHLLGYRHRMVDKNHMILNNREWRAKNELYKTSWWFGKKSQNKRHT